MVGECQREGVPLGWVADGPGPAGTMLAEIGDDGRGPDPASLTWDARQLYLLLRLTEAPEYWMRATPVYGARIGYHVDAVLHARETEPDHGVRRWQVLTAAGEPVLLADDPAVGHGRPWLLRSDASYDVEYDVEGWRVYGHDVPEGIVALPEP
ncbi:hypothetical protein [Saccharopolyspora taberi]